MFADLLVVVEVLLALDGPEAGFTQRVDAIHPLAAACTDVASDDDTKRCAVDLRERLAVHLPREKHFLRHPHLPPWDGDSVVVDLELPVRLISTRPTQHTKSHAHLKYVSAPMNSTCWHSGRTPPHAILRTLFRGTPR